ncbi:hypothetical protein Egran_02712 [Elaphomyces granulatus]|uniref:Uncharacterized protein n=1 Tax=Elaphomyces granulatus TaxID=519963 RepID=A0A232LZD1_9EURO|nr:hypothetical protein Egran_02712 [Elaphomyces granulatus]
MSQMLSLDHDFSSIETPRVHNGRLSITALARFEFEAGKGNEGTKILMVEWEDDDLTRSPAGSWHVSWEGKKAVLPADEQTSENTRRFYFLLPPDVTIPPIITLIYEPPPSSASTARKLDSIQVNPLPAIFSAELGATARTAGKKGVLHTIWAKKRLQALEKEIREECISNAEGIALQIAIREKEWIESNFGVSFRLATQSVSGLPSSYLPTTPVSPTSGRRLGEKLKGLKLETSEKDLTKRADGKTMHPLSEKHKTTNLRPLLLAQYIHKVNAEAQHLLSPESPDVAISSFNSFRNSPISAHETRRLVAHHPPASIQQAQRGGNDFGSMDSIARTTGMESGDELFAKALSPRSPDIPRSPFSFSLKDTVPYFAAKRA